MQLSKALTLLLLMGLQASEAIEIQLTGTTTRTCNNLEFNECCAAKEGENFNQTRFWEPRRGYCVKVFGFNGLKDSCEGALRAQQWINANITSLNISATSISGARVELVPVQAGCPKFPGVMEDAHKDAQKVMEIPLL